MLAMHDSSDKRLNNLTVTQVLYEQTTAYKRWTSDSKLANASDSKIFFLGVQKVSCEIL